MLSKPKNKITAKKGWIIRIMKKQLIKKVVRKKKDKSHEKRNIAIKKRLCKTMKKK